MTAFRGPKRRHRLKIATMIAVLCVGLIVGEHRASDIPPEFRQDVFFRDLPEGMRSDISRLEAHLLWIIRDPVPADGTVYTFTRNFVTMLRRASPFELLIVIPLDILMPLTGESLMLTRLIAVAWIALTADESVTVTRSIAIAAAGLILATAAYTLLPGISAALVRRHRRRPTLWPLLFGGLFVCAVFSYLLAIYVSPFPPIDCPYRYLDDMDSAMDAYLTEHAAGDPVITIFAEDSRFAHFAAIQDLRLDNRIDLSQREFSTGEIEALIASIDNDRIWVLFERGAPHLDLNVDAVVSVVMRSDRGMPFLRGTVLYYGNLEPSDFWRIYGYDANSNVLSPRVPHPLYCSR